MQDYVSSVPASIVLFEVDKYIGTYRIENNHIFMETDDGLYHYTFLLEEENLVILESESSEPARFKNERKIVDGDIFISNKNTR